MASEKGNPGICAHCGGEVAEDGYAVNIADVDGDEGKSEPQPAREDTESGFFAALRARRTSSAEPAHSEEGA